MEIDENRPSYSTRPDALDYQRPTGAGFAWIFPLMGILSVILALDGCGLLYMVTFHWQAVQRQIAGRAGARSFWDMFWACSILFPSVATILGIISGAVGLRKHWLFTIVCGVVGVNLSVFFVEALLLVWVLNHLIPCPN